MTKLSKAISAGRIVEYHYDHQEQNVQSAYYSEGGRVVGQFHGKLAEEFGLIGKPATEEIVRRLAEGQHPWTGEQLVKHRTPPATPEWQLRTSAWTERLESQFLKAMESGKEPYVAQPIPGRPRGPEAIVEEPRDLAVPKYDEHQQALIRMHEDAARFYVDRLGGESGGRGRLYLENRGFSEATWREFQLGFAGSENELVRHLEGRYSRDQLLASGLVYARQSDGALQDRFRDRIMIPMQDAAGNVVAFSGRRVDGNKDRKYINSPTTAIFQKSQTLYNAHRAAAESSGRLVVVEGPLKAIRAHQAGVRKVVALSGTSMDPEQVKALSSHVLLNLDANEAGRAATEKHITRLLDAGIDVRAISLEGDPDGYILNRGAEAFRSQVENAKPLVTWLAERAREKFGSQDAHGKAAGYRWMIEQLGHVNQESRAAIDEELRRHLGLPADDELGEKKYTEHRAAVDMMFAPPKSVSAQALVGGDQRIVEIHNRAVKVALDRVQEFVQARYRDVRATTGNWVATTFLHDVSRPVGDHVPNPQLHTHSVIFNMTRSGNEIRSMDPGWLYRVQSYANAVYLSEVANDLRALGYELERGKNFSMEIKGYSREYLDAISLRSSEIEAEKKRRGVVGAEAGELVAINSRQAKQHWDPAALRAEHRREAEEFGQDPAAIEAAALARGGYRLSAEQRAKLANEALNYAKERLYHGQSVNEEFELMRDALRYSPDMLRIADVEAAFEARNREFVEVRHYRVDAPGQRYTTPEMKALERESIRMVLRGQGITEPIVAGLTRDEFREAYKTRVVNGHEIKLNDSQMWMAYKTLTSRNQVVIVAGAAGVGKSTSFEPVTEIAEQHRDAGYRVVGLAATTSATNNLREMGIDASTLQLHNVRGVKPGTKKTLYLLDEGSLVGAQSFDKFMTSVRPEDRVIIAYDHRQHHSVEAGRIVEELEKASVQTIRLEKIVRQRENPELLAVIEKFRDSFGHRGSLRMIEGLEMLDDQARIWQDPNRERRFAALATWYAHNPDDAVVINPDNRSIDEIAVAVRGTLQKKGIVQPDAYEAVVLKNVRGMTDADKKLASSYEPGNVIRWGRAGTLGGRGRVSSGQYTTVLSIDAEKNEIRIRIGDSFGVHDVAFDPRVGQGEVYESAVRRFAVGDKVQITRPWTIKRGDVIANGAVGTIRSLTSEGKAELEIDGRMIAWDIKEMPHADYAFAMTSYRAQSLTVRHVAVHIDTGDTRLRPLIEKALLYVGASRAAEDVMIFTDDRETLLSPEESPILRQHDKPMALSEKEVEEEALQVKVVA